jgi:hypothetical protein
MLRTIALAFTAILGFSLPAVAASPVVPHTQTFSFSAGDSLRVHVSAGDVKIVNGSDPRHIVLRYTAKSKNDGGDASGCVKTRFEAKGSEVEIVLKGRTNGSCDLDVEVEVPSPVNLSVRMTAGDLVLDGVQGNIDAVDRVGDITINPGPEKEYSLIQASTRIGDLDGMPGRVHGWLGKSGKVTGAGQYRLYAHVWVGDVHLSFD